jgi:hypothetical protein
MQASLEVAKQAGATSSKAARNNSRGHAAKYQILSTEARRIESLEKTCNEAMK